MDAFDISASALTAQRLRLDVIASNLANVNTTRDANGKLSPYHRRNVVFAPILQGKMSEPSGGSLSLKAPTYNQPGLGGGSMANGSLVLKTGISFNQDGPGSAGVQVVEVAEDNKTPMKLIYDPGHPDADEKGYVQLPNINPVNEMVDMIAASRAYEANVSSIQTAKSMGKAALDI